MTDSPTQAAMERLRDWVKAEALCNGKSGNSEHGKAIVRLLQLVEAVTPRNGEAVVKIIGGEGYEDVCPELIAQDAMTIDFAWELLMPDAIPKPGGGE